MKTLALRNDTWDLYIDNQKNLAIKESNDRIAQDVSTSCRVFLGEMDLDINRGVDYRNPDKIRKTIKNDLRKQALLIDGVEEAVVLINKIDSRRANVTIYVTNENGDKITIGDEKNE